MVRLLISEAITLLGQRQYAEAIELLNQATQLAPDNYDAWHLLAVAHMILQQWEPSLDAWNHALAHSAYGYARRNSLCLKAGALMRLERYEEALAAYDEVLKIDTIDPREPYALQPHARQLALKALHDSAWHGKGHALGKLGRHEEARAAYVHAEVGRASILRDLRHYEEALALYDSILAQSPQSVQTWREKAATLRAAGRHDEAAGAEQHLKEMCG